jgi:hypothetical protein
MTEKLKQNLKEQLALLPKESQGVINSFDWVKISEEIGKKYFLTEEDINMFQADVGLVLVGLAEQEYLAQDIEDDVIISKDHAEKMAEEVIEKILKPMVLKLTEIIKKDLKNKVIHWQQNLDFILSGGDYTAFIRRVENQTQNISNIKKEFDPSKIDDLKKRFTI